LRTEQFFTVLSAGFNTSGIWMSSLVTVGDLRESVDNAEMKELISLNELYWTASRGLGVL